MSITLGIVTRGNDISAGLLSFVAEAIFNKEIDDVLLSSSPLSANEGQENLLQAFLKLEARSHILVIDSDVIPPSNTIAELLKVDGDIVVAPVWHYDPVEKDIHVGIHYKNLWVSNRMHVEKKTGIERILAASFSILLIKREAVSRIIEETGSFIGDWDKITDFSPHTHADNIFFRKASMIGLKAYVNWDVKGAVHARRIELSTEVIDKLVTKRLHEMHMGREE